MHTRNKLAALATQAYEMRQEAVNVSNVLVSQPHLGGTPVTDNDDAFQHLLSARASVRAAQLSIEDAINAVQVWRKS